MKKMNILNVKEGDILLVKDPDIMSEKTIELLKGKVEIINPEKSELAKELKINKKGLYAIRL